MTSLKDIYNYVWNNAQPFAGNILVYRASFFFLAFFRDVGSNVESESQTGGFRMR